MTANYGAPKYAHIGPCQNLLKGSADSWTDSRYCGTPTIALGGEFKLDRDICQECAGRGRVFRENLIKQFARGVVDGDACEDWLRRSDESMRWMADHILQLAKRRVPMREIIAVRCDMGRLAESIVHVRIAQARSNMRKRASVV